MNKTEAAFAQYMRNGLANMEHHVMEQAIRLRLANGAWYKPDVVTVTQHGIHAYEVKGFRRQAGILALKVAAGMYPWIRFYLVQAQDRSLRGWNMTEVLP